MRKMMGVILIASLIIWLYPGSAAAAENEFESAFKDGIYGGLAGALVGGAVLVFADHPEDHYIYIGYGAAIGVFLGVTFGFVSAARSLAEVDDHKLVFHFPIPQTEVLPLDPAHREVLTSMNLLTVRF